MPEKEIKSQLDGMKELLKLSAQRSQLSAGRSYMNAERTLSVWIRTALASMIFGIAIDRLGLMLDMSQLKVINETAWNKPTMITGILMVSFSILIALSSGIRFLIFVKEYKKEFQFPPHHTGKLPSFFAFMTTLFGAILLYLMLGIA